MDKNKKNDKFYFFKIDRDKIKLQLRNISSKFIKPRQNKKIISIFITFFLLVGVVIALYTNNNDSEISTDYFETEQQNNIVSESVRGNETIDLNTEELTLADREEEEITEETRNNKQEFIEKELRSDTENEIEGVVTESVTDIQEVKNRIEQEIQLLRPVAGEVINEPGWYFHPVFEDWRYQQGIKMEGNTGDIVMAAESGEVAEIYEDEYKGIAVKIKHNDSWQTLYAYLQRTPLVEGEIVGKGQEVGRIGTTGITEEPCLYFELLNNGEVMNPVEYFE